MREDRCADSLRKTALVAWTCAANEQQPYSKKYTTRQS